MELSEFLIKAKTNTYASCEEEKERILYQGQEIYRLNYHGGFVTAR